MLKDKAWEALTVERQRFEPLISGIESRVKELKAESAAGCSFVSQAEKVGIPHYLTPAQKKQMSC